jgi:hypothetical protein
VFVAGGRDRLAVRRESFTEFLALHDVAKEHDWSSPPLPEANEAVERIGRRLREDRG